MEEDFYKKSLKEKYNIETIIPPEDERQVIHDIIFNELCLGKIFHKSRFEFIKIIDSLIQNGAEGIILGCTEIPLLISQNDSPVPVFDTTKIHAVSAVDYALK
jgi:aspartate racemase